MKDSTASTVRYYIWFVYIDVIKEMYTFNPARKYLIDQAVRVKIFMIQKNSAE